MARGRKGNWLQRLNNRLIAMRAGRAVRRQRKAESDEREIKTEAERVLASLLLPMRLEEFDVALAALTGVATDLRKFYATQRENYQITKTLLWWVFGAM